MSRSSSTRHEKMKRLVGWKVAFDTCSVLELTAATGPPVKWLGRPSRTRGVSAEQAKTEVDEPISRLRLLRALAAGRKFTESMS